MFLLSIAGIRDKADNKIKNKKTFYSKQPEGSSILPSLSDTNSHIINNKCIQRVHMYIHIRTYSRTTFPHKTQGKVIIYFWRRQLLICWVIKQFSLTYISSSITYNLVKTDIYAVIYKWTLCYNNLVCTFYTWERLF